MDDFCQDVVVEGQLPNLRPLPGEHTDKQPGYPVVYYRTKATSGADAFGINRNGKDRYCAFKLCKSSVLFVYYRLHGWKTNLGDDKARLISVRSRSYCEAASSFACQSPSTGQCFIGVNCHSPQLERED